jgi:hypothetical protein
MTQATKEKIRLACTNCGSTDFYKADKVYQVGMEMRKHVGAYCIACGRWRTWVKQPKKGCINGRKNV